MRMDEATGRLDPNIDYDSLAEFYDLYVNTTFDVPFWLDVARRCGEPRLELMCGPGGIGLRILSAGMDVDGLDYSQKVLAAFREKLSASMAPCDLHLADARRFCLERWYRLIFIGFHAIAEVLNDNDKADVFSCAAAHLLPEGRFWVSAHNPSVRARTLDGRSVDLARFSLPGSGEEVAVAGRYLYDPHTGIASGKQMYVCTREGRRTRAVELPIRFHLVAPDRIDELLASAGLQVVSRHGNYDREGFKASSSPFYIVEAARPAP